MSYLDLAEGLVKRLEGCFLTGYHDSVGKPTIGYGHTGPEVRIGQTITQEIADHDLAVDLGIADRRLSEVCKPDALTVLHDHQRAALVSFVFNVGANPSWTIWKDINAGNLADVPTQLMRFDHGMVGGKEVVIPGLEHRRTAEVIFWNTGDQAAALSVTTTANTVASPPSGYTRDIVTPPRAVAPPPGVGASLGAKIVAIAGGIGATATQLHGIVLPHVAESPIFQNMAVGCSAAVVAAGCVGVILHTHQAQARQQ